MLENLRYLTLGPRIAFAVEDPRSHLFGYSQLSLMCVHLTCLTGEMIHLAMPLRKVMSDQYRFLTKDDREALESLFIDAKLELTYASGNHAVNSLRGADLVHTLLEGPEEDGSESDEP